MRYKSPGYKWREVKNIIRHPLGIEVLLEGGSTWCEHDMEWLFEKWEMDKEAEEELKLMQMG